MDRSRDEVCFGGADVRRHGHERIELVDLKKLGYAVFKDRRSKWTKPGTSLHARIEPILHGSMPRVGEDRAMPQGTGADFGAPLEPTDDLSRGKIARDCWMSSSSGNRLCARPACRKASPISASP